MKCDFGTYFFFVWCWWLRESVLQGSSSLSQFHSSLSKLLTLWHCVKVKQSYLVPISLQGKFTVKKIDCESSKITYQNVLMTKNQLKSKIEKSNYYFDFSMGIGKGAMCLFFVLFIWYLKPYYNQTRHKIYCFFGKILFTVHIVDRAVRNFLMEN